MGEAYLPSMYSYGMLLTSVPGDGDASLPSLVSKGGEGEYGDGVAHLQSFVSYGSEGKGNYIAEIFNVGYIVGGSGLYTDAIVFINSTGQIVDTISGTRELISIILSTVTATDTYTLLGQFSVTISEDLYGTDNIVAALGDAASLDDTTRVWVINTDSGASSQYDNYGYNSFFTRDGKAYGVAEDGIFRLDGTTDNGTAIDALIEIGRSDFESSQQKTIPNVYLGISSTNKMYLKIEADGQEYTYEARSSSTTLKTHRVDPGKGLKGNYFNLTIMNNTGSDFDLETVTFKPIQLSRKI